VNEWLRIMLEEIRRKREQQDADRDEHRRRTGKTRREDRSGEAPARRDQNADR